ncbi:hypothetical protein OJ998_15600 [Solirubrobacter taibaiensis]|nr:hypothetical protein [Solirubrobacter taibaiensis]
MGYMLYVAPIAAGVDPGLEIRRLVAAAEHPQVDSAKQLRNQELARQLVELEPRLERDAIDVEAVAAADPELRPGQIAQLGREINLGIPGVQISIGDDWASFEVATWPELAEPTNVARLTGLVEIACARTGWVCVGEHDEVFATPRLAVESATATAKAWGHAVRRQVNKRERRRPVRRWLRRS